MPSKDAKLPAIATRDIGVLAAKSLMSPPARSEVIDLIGPVVSVDEMVGKLGAALGKQLQIVDIPPQGHVDAMTKAGVPKPFAEAFAEMYAAFATGKVGPKGDRLVQGSTKLDEVIATLVK